MRAAIVVVTFLLLLAPGTRRVQAVDNPTVVGPIAGGLRGHALWDSWFDLADLGYMEEEYFVSGNARTSPSSPATAPYTTRIIVTRPIAAADFNGTVLFDWVNVTAQFENPVDTLTTHELLHREGYAYVHVSAQSAGICCTPLTPMIWDPLRYASLSHPGDAYAYDMFSQIVQALKFPDPLQGPDPMGGLAVEVALAAGQSQSASRLDTYVREWQPSEGVIDGFLIHGGGSKTYDPPPAAPVLHLLSDAEADEASPNTSVNYTLWEIAGTAHSDFYIGYHQVYGQGPRALADAPKQPGSADAALHVVAGNYGEQIHPNQGTCIAAGATMPMRYAASAAVTYLDRWVRLGDAGRPPAGARYQFSAGQLALDQYQNALGGIRLPPIDVPVATYLSTACVLGGLTVPFSDAQLQLLYPSHADYACQMQARTDAAVAAGFMLPPDAADLMTRVAAVTNRWLVVGTPPCDNPCGNGALDAGEACDDANTASGDGCDGLCAVEACYTCAPLEPSVCLPNLGAGCDDGNVCTTGDVCGPTAVCTGLPNLGTSCDDGNQCTSGDACNATGACVGTATVAASCNDGNACTTMDTCDAAANCFGTAACGACQTCDPGVGCLGTPCAPTPTPTPTPPLGCGATPIAGCRTPAVAEKALLRLRNVAPDGKDRLHWRWLKGATTAKTDFGNPLVATSYVLCAYDGNADLILDTTAPAGGACGSPGHACWRANASGFRYVDKDLTPDGLLQVVLKAGPAGKAQIKVNGKGALLGLPTLPIADLPVRMQLVGSNGACFEAVYGSTFRNDAGQFKAKAD